jgi:hypothetical protein
MTIQLLNFEKVVSKDSELVPQAIIGRPVSFFERRRMKFVEGHDDLDSYQATALSLNGQLVALIHYRGHQQDTVTVYLPQANDLAATSATIARLIDELDLPQDSIIWKRTDDVSL